MKRLFAFIMVFAMLLSVMPAVVQAADTSDLSSKLLAEYNFDNQTTNDAVGSNNATFYNNATAATANYVGGVSGKALKLSTQGTDEKYWLSVPYSAFGSNTDSFTISLWYNSTGHNASGENSELFTLYNSSAEKFLFYGAQADGNKNAFTMKWDGTYGYANVIGGYKENEWVHLVFAVDVIDGQSKITSYINGQAVGVDQGGAWANSLMSQMGINTFTIGGKNPYKGGATPKCLFYGSVDEVQLYAGALNADEAAFLYDSVVNAPVERGTLLAEYNFDDQTTNDSKGIHNATFYDNATATTANYVDGVSGKALKLSTQGTEEKYWLSVPYGAFGSSTDSFTISLWYNSAGHNTSGENSELFTLYNSSAEKFLFYGAQADGNKNAFTMKWDGTYGYANVIGGYKENEWVHLVFAVDVVDGQSKITSYINGQAVGVDQGGAWANSLMSQMGINTFTIGGKNPYKGGATPKCLFYGSVDEVRLYAGALNASEAADIYNAIANPPAQRGDLLAEYNFDDQSTNDSKGIHNATFYDNATATTANYVDGVSGKALKLSTQGTEEKYWLSVPYGAFGSNTDSFTISLWYNSAGHNTSGENSELFTLYNSSAEKFLFYGAQADGNKNAMTMKWDSTYGYANVIGGYKENEWVHLAFAVDAVDGQSVITAYVNGKAVGVDQGGAWANSLMSQMGINTFTIGGKNPYKGGATPKCLFYGSVDEVQLYAGVLNATEVADIYNAIANPPAQRGDLLAEYNFDNETTNDTKGNNHATFYDNATATDAVFVEGISGKALKLSTQGTEEKYWLSVPYGAFGSNTDSFTISLWYNSTGHNTSGENSELFTLYNSSAEKFLFYGAQADGNKNAMTMKWDSTYGYANVIGGYTENEWVHLAFAVDNVDGQSKITAYVNGKTVKVDQGGAWANSLMSQMGINTFTIGGKNPYKGGATPKCLFYGSVDEVQLYAGALTHAEALALYEENAAMWVTPEPVTDYAYSFAVVGDTQIISYEDPDNLHKIYDWIIDNKENENIQFVFGLGDITDRDTDAEWIIAKEQIHRMDGVVPYSVIRGNHDGSGQYLKYFPYSDYADVLAGSYDETMFNTFQKLTVGETNYLIVNLDVGASDEVLAWANDVVAAHSNYNVIVTTHAYLDYDGNWIDDSFYVAPTVLGFPNNGDDIWEKFVSKHANISLVLCGHVDNDNITVTTAVGDHGNTVTQMLIDPQGLDAGYGSTGMVAMLYFSEDGKNVDVRYYSTVRESYFRDENQFAMEMPGVVVGDGMGTVSQRQVLLSDDIGMKLYAQLTDRFVSGSGMYAKICVGSAEQKVMLSDMEPQIVDGKSYYVFTANVAAAQMTETITLQFFNGADEGGEIYTCTVRDYLVQILNSQDYADSHQIASQLLNYGAKAQAYFGVNTDDFANAGYEIDTEHEIPQENMETDVSGNVSGIRFYGAALVFEHRIAVRYYFIAEGAVDGYSFAVNGKTYTPVNKGDMYYIEIAGINPQDYATVIELIVTDGNSSISIEYSPMHYIVRMYSKTESTQLKELLDALYNYHLTAENYSA